MTKVIGHHQNGVKMPTYEWSCESCGHEWDVVTTIANRDEPEKCNKCPGQGVRGITTASIDKSSAGDWNNVSYNPGLGCWTKSWKHGREIAKARGLEEIGNERPDKIEKSFEKQRAETREQRWRDADRVKMYD